MAKIISFNSYVDSKCKIYKADRDLTNSVNNFLVLTDKRCRLINAKFKFFRQFRLNKVCKKIESLKSEIKEKVSSY